MNYEKYIKYKQKYNYLKYKQFGGDINDIFPDYNDVDKSKLQITEEGLYSVSKVDGAQFTINKIIENLGTKDIIITDGTGNVGSDTIMFGINFKKVNSVEIKKDNFDALKNNVKQYKLKNIKVINDDINKRIKKLKQDVIYLDAPWGGINYKTMNKLKLYLGDKEILDFVLENNKKAKLFVLKVPYNYDFEYLDNKMRDYKVIRYPYIKFDKIKYYIILIAIAS